MSTEYQFVLQSIRMKSVSFLTHPEREEPKANEEIDIKPLMTIAYHTGAKSSVEVDLKFSLEEGNLPFSIHVTTAGLFTFQKLPAKELLQKVIHINCASILFPFLREHIADLTRRAGFPPLLLPPTNFVALYEQGKKTVPRKRATRKK